MFVSLNAVTATGAGSELETPVSENYTIQLKHTGSPTSVIVDVEGSVNGRDWVQVAQHTMAASDDMFHVAGKPLRNIRLNLTTLSGGSSPTVTGLILTKL